jgi:hypothetical protein
MDATQLQDPVVDDGGFFAPGEGRIQMVPAQLLGLSPRFEGRKSGLVVQFFFISPPPNAF